MRYLGGPDMVSKELIKSEPSSVIARVCHESLLGSRVPRVPILGRWRTVGLLLATTDPTVKETT
jgi:uncharacterized protein YbbK (DUF523 family)